MIKNSVMKVWLGWQKVIGLFWDFFFSLKSNVKMIVYEYREIRAFSLQQEKL